MEDHRKQPGGCSHPPALNDLALIAAVDGEASSDVIAHLRGCRSCARRAQEFAELQGLLRKQLYRVLCPSSDELLAFHQGWLDDEKTTRIQSHLSMCPHCAADLRLLVETASVPAMAAPSPIARLRKVVAELLAPRAPLPLASAYGALRGAPGSTQYAYRAENLQLMIDVERAACHPGHMILLGMLLPDDDDGDERLTSATASLLHDDTIVTSAALDELGNFVLDDIAPGDYSLSLRLPDREVVVEALSL